MEIVEQRNQPAGTQFTVVVAILVTLVIALAGVALTRHSNPPVNTPPARAAAAGLGPDAQDRNSQILAARLGKAEATHGH